MIFDPKRITSNDELVGIPIDGLIGGGFFRNLIANIDTVVTG
jgi:hypothetical protein